MPLVKRGNSKTERKDAIGICEFEGDQNVSVGVGKIFVTIDESFAGKRLTRIIAKTTVAPIGNDITGRLLLNSVAIAGSNFLIEDGTLVSTPVTISQILSEGDDLRVEVLTIADPATPGTGLSVTASAK